MAFFRVINVVSGLATDIMRLRHLSTAGAVISGQNIKLEVIGPNVTIPTNCVSIQLKVNGSGTVTSINARAFVEDGDGSVVSGLGIRSKSSLLRIGIGYIGSGKRVYGLSAQRSSFGEFTGMATWGLHGNRLNNLGFEIGISGSGIILDEVSVFFNPSGVAEGNDGGTSSWIG